MKTTNFKNYKTLRTLKRLRVLTRKPYNQQLCCDIFARTLNRKIHTFV